MRLLTTLLLAGLLAAPVIAEAQRGPRASVPGPMHHRMQEGMGIERLLRHAEDLKLTDQQQSQLEKLSREFRLAQIDRRAELAKSELELRDLMRDAEPSDQAMIDAAIDNVADLRAGMQKARVKQRLAVQSILTDEQEAQIRERLREQREKRFKGAHGKPGAMRGELGPDRFFFFSEDNGMLLSSEPSMLPLGDDEGEDDVLLFVEPEGEEI